MSSALFPLRSFSTMKPKPLFGFAAARRCRSARGRGMLPSPLARTGRRGRSAADAVDRQRSPSSRRTIVENQTQDRRQARGHRGRRARRPHLRQPRRRAKPHRNENSPTSQPRFALRRSARRRSAPLATPAGCRGRRSSTSGDQGRRTPSCIEKQAATLKLWNSDFRQQLIMGRGRRNRRGFIGSEPRPPAALRVVSRTTLVVLSGWSTFG